MVAQNIVVLGTGGTIAGTAADPLDHLGYTPAQLAVDQLVSAVPPLAGWLLVAEQVAQVDSKDMDETVWRQLALRCAHWLAREDVQGLVVTHGTDTLEETAFFLCSVLATDKPVVLTCAMRPASALMPDGPQNLFDAACVARCPGARGVLAVCAGRVHGALEVHKRHSYQLDAFDSGEAGPVAVVEDGRVRLLREWPSAQALQPGLLDQLVEDKPWPRVVIVSSHAGVDGELVDALVAQGVAGIVVAGTGNGTVHRRLEAALLRALDAGVAVLRSTRCEGGRVLAHAGDRLPDAGGLSPVKARIHLQLSLLARGVG
ncbi:asparaginase [Ramlibacter rhizophilus]|uniref:Asparaginase n=1 Tax=Ramlibacter rhizophilus TaxID=1781167 RepID=A0A4Z0C0M3_9BURK|nr:asparaginase [Ramlibacter rhizophilus]TFZ04761.1 asparaginase [Ramlibacter rhizophilus]